MFNAKKKTTPHEKLSEFDYQGVCRGKIIDIKGYKDDDTLHEKKLGLWLDENENVIRIHFYQQEAQVDPFNQNLYAEIFINGQPLDQIMVVLFTNRNPFSEQKFPSVTLTPNICDKNFSFETFIRNEILKQKPLEKENVVPTMNFHY
jgi:hypothetical protein